MKSLLLLGSAADYKISEKDFDIGDWKLQHQDQISNLERLVYGHCNCEEENAQCFV